MQIVLWRLYRRAHGSGLDGIGGLYAQGRWHKLGSRVVYLGSTASLVVLERLAHLDPRMLPDDLVLGKFAADLNVEHIDDAIDIHDLTQTQATGLNFMRSGQAAVLAVPSILVPEELNFVLNPAHPAAATLDLLSERDFSFDSRLL
jgi:RES domain-containing protein